MGIYYYKQQTTGGFRNNQLVMRSFLSQKQLEKLVMVINDGNETECLFQVTTTDENPNKQYYQTDTGGDEVGFTLEFAGDEYKGFELIIEVGFIGHWSTTILHSISDEKVIDNSQLKLIKFLIKNFTDSIGNSVYPKWK